jgi:phosphoribosylamine--glycine ligase
VRVLVVGGGAREHALGWKLSLSSSGHEIYFAPGNVGTAALGTNLNVSPNSVEELAKWARNLGVHLTIVGPEAPLAAGIVDHFASQGLKVFGPNRAAARIEASKAFARELMASAGIPGPAFAIFDQPAPAVAYVERSALPLVVKADGLAAGKGARICFSRRDALMAIEEIMVQRIFGAAGDRVVIEQFLDGKEASAMAFVAGEQVSLMPPARDYKRLLDGHRGPNTGGMGAICPIPEDSRQLRDSIVAKVLQPAVKTLLARGIHYTGILYAGLMLTSQGPQVLEFNCRFGDPEAQAVLPLMQADLLETIEGCMEGNLSLAALDWKPRYSCAVVLASEGYPDNARTGVPIRGLEAVESHERWVFHAGTATSDGSIVTAGGRVLTVAAVADIAAQARQRAYEGVALVAFEGMQYRRDIGL